MYSFVNRISGKTWLDLSCRSLCGQKVATPEPQSSLTMYARTDGITHRLHPKEWKKREACENRLRQPKLTAYNSFLISHVIVKRQVEQGTMVMAPVQK